MKLLRLTIYILLGLLLCTSYVSAQEISISIDKIEANELITGYVRGIESQQHKNYKILIYVHTDKWYIHPYAGQGEGLSWAVINSDGTWSLETVRRRFRADKMAALLVKQSYPEPSTEFNLKRIPYEAVIIKELRGTEDYGKL